ncbi:SRPBCC family protein [Salinisphaera aquimarina]|uniref:SRPBCC family protein n=1 Tax=Salinisphaera aquimarina TaxID=2094031 RepID=A0ABV7EPT0_9GAMM
MTPTRPDSDRRQNTGHLESVRERERQQSLALFASVGTLMVAIRRGGLSGLALGAFSGLLAYRASTGQGLKGTGSAIAHCAERMLTGHKTGSMHLTTGVTISRPPEDLYAFWRDFTRLPEIMTSIIDVQTLDDGRSHWRARTPIGETLEWDAEITDDQPNEFIAWRSLEGAEVPQRGEIRFVPGPAGRGTQVELDLHYALPHGLLSAAPLSFVNGLSRELLREDLRHFKQLMEAGEIPSGGTRSLPQEGVTS